MKSPQQILTCQRIGQQKRLKVLKKLEAVLDNHNLYHGSLTIQRLAKISDVSRPWFYQQQGLKEIFTGRRTTQELIQLLKAWLIWEKSFLDGQLMSKSKDLSKT